MPHNFQSEKASSKATVQTDNRLPGRPRPRFVLAHHPDSWEFIDGHYLPMIKHIPLVPGVNGCREGENGHRPAIVRLQADRFTVLDDEIDVKVTDPETGEIITESGYMLKWEGRRGAHYSDTWCSPMLVGSGRELKVDWSTGFDHAGYNAWRLWLLESGHIKPPEQSALSRLVRIQGRRAKRRVGESHDGNPHVQAHVKAQFDKLEAMQKAAGLDKKSPRPVRAKPKRVRNG